MCSACSSASGASLGPTRQGKLGLERAGHKKEEEFQWCCALLCPSSPSPCLAWKNAGIRGNQGQDSAWGACGRRGCSLWGFGGFEGFGEVQLAQLLHFGNLWRVGCGGRQGSRTPSTCSQLHPSCNFSVPPSTGAGPGAVNRNKPTISDHILPAPSQNL